MYPFTPGIPVEVAFESAWKEAESTAEDKEERKFMPAPLSLYTILILRSGGEWREGEGERVDFEMMTARNPRLVSRFSLSDTLNSLTPVTECHLKRKSLPLLPSLYLVQK